jgi:heterotetrameric sarcosine oxidase gamma subunit
VTLEFLQPDRGAPELGFEPVPASVLLPQAREAGARIEVREGWRVAADYGSVERELEACRATAGFGDSSWLGKIELQGPADDLSAVAAAAGGEGIELGRASSAADAWWCPFSGRRLLAVCDPGRTPALRESLEDAAAQRPVSVIDLTCALAAVTIVGPQAPELLARLTALDLRPDHTPECSFRPGSVARIPAMVIRERRDRYVLLFGSAYAQYMSAQLTDAAEPLGAYVVGADALARAREEVAAGA